MARLPRLLGAVGQAIVQGALAWVACAAWAQGAAPPASPTPAPVVNPIPLPPVPGGQAAPADEPAQVRIGRRVDATRRAATVGDVLVLVRDAGSYTRAIGEWSPTARFPVLIDDGTLEGMENIARFARAFRPARVVRWNAAGDAGGTYDGASFAKTTIASVTDGVARAWDVPEGAPGSMIGEDALLAHWRGIGHTPPGIVLMNVEDPAWAGGLALAAGRGQAVGFVPMRQGFDATIGAPETEILLRASERVAETSGWSWRGLGDDLEGVTIAMNSPNRYDTGKELLAMSDRVGRLGPAATPGARWAWGGHAFGTAPVSVYRAMCALFLQPQDAWLFDGYPNEGAWAKYDCTQAAEILREGGLRAEVLDSPRTTSWDWRIRAARPVSGGLVMVNTKGNDDFFEVHTGRCLPGDVPVLDVPAAAAIVHSWSATAAANRDRLGGRWLERGVFVYAGSVHEPYLGGFVPTPALAGRLRAGAPFGVAARLDGAPWWKITILGDPLYTLGPPAPRGERGALPGEADVLGTLRDDLTGARYASAIRALMLAGRDADVARLGATLLEQNPDAISPEVAELLVLPFFRAGFTQSVWRVFARMSPTRQRDPILRDALWLSATPLLEARPEDGLLSVLKSNVRAFQGVRDAMLLAHAWERGVGVNEAMNVLRDIRERLPSQAEKDELDRLLRAPAEQWGR
ncbi:MAG: hypothetical protein SFY69_01540 [Planctomycetota bacterium]|nr:hypothetical protein [Planctomycetota bacterium]